MWRPASFLLCLLLPIVTVAGAQLGGAATFAGVILVFVLFPLLDLLLGRSTDNPPDPQAWEGQRGYRVVTYLIFTAEAAFLVWATLVAARAPMKGLERVGFLTSASLSAAVIGIPLAHELYHKTSRLERFLGLALLVPLNYMHYYLEHIHSHHVRVSTREDPSSAPLGESFWHFLPRTLVGGVKVAWAVERDRLRRAGPWPWTPRNRMLWFLFGPPLLLGAITATLGPGVLALFAGQWAAAVLLVSSTNYFEHYGLERRELAEGKFEPVRAHHAWDSLHRFGSFFLLGLPRHADHHLHPRRRYQALCADDRVPMLPAGYPSMVLLTLVPPLWRRVMDPLVARARAARENAEPPS